MATKLKNLKSVGIQELWQVPLYLPTGYVNACNVYSDFGGALPEGVEIVIKGELKSYPQTNWRNKSPLTKGMIFDPNGNFITYSIFGDSRKFVEAIQERKQCLYLRGVIKCISGINYLNQVALVDEHLIGKMIPIYPGKAGKLNPDTARSLIHERLDEALLLAGDKLRELLGDIVDAKQLRSTLECPKWSLTEVLEKAHRPASMDEANSALEIMDRMAALISVSDIRKTSQVPVTPRPPLQYGAWRTLLDAIPFALTTEQTDGMQKLTQALMGSTVSSTLINGDVGMGKSVLYQVAAAYTVRAGGRCAVLLPHGRLAAQARDEFSSLWPDLNPLLITGNTGAGELESSSLLVGTTALLFRDIGPLDLVVIDEQHRFSVEQRQILAAKKSHVIELSATPIPRTQALLRYGRMNLVQLTKRHCDQDIRTHLVYREQARQMVAMVNKVIENTQSRVLIVCSQVESKENAVMELSAVETVYDKWEKLFPGLVRMAHSRLDQEALNRSFSDLISGDGRILVCSSVVETGLNLPDTRVMIVVNADRFGVSQLHQLRGRLSRSGGWGRFYLYLPKQVKEDTQRRLEMVASTNDGFALSQLDLELRGGGDLTSDGKKQHGSSDTVIFNRVVPLELLEKMSTVVCEN